MTYFPRSAYFKTALNTDVGDTSKTLEVTEFSYEVLSAAVDFMYGIELPEDFNNRDDLKGLLHLADLYLMDNLKDAAGSRIGKDLCEDDDDSAVKNNKQRKKASNVQPNRLTCQDCGKTFHKVNECNCVLLISPFRPMAYPAIPALGCADSRKAFHRSASSMNIISYILFERFIYLL